MAALFAKMKIFRFFFKSRFLGCFRKFFELFFQFWLVGHRFISIWKKNLNLTLQKSLTPALRIFGEEKFKKRNLKRFFMRNLLTFRNRAENRNSRLEQVRAVWWLLIDMPKRYVWDMPNIFLRFISDLPDVCLRYVWYLPEICFRYA